MMKKLLRFDWASRHILRSKSGFGILEGFVSELLLENTRIKGILGSLNQLTGLEEKFTKTDYLAENSKGEIIIQIQNNRDDHYFQRMLLGTSKALTDNFLGYGSNKSRKLVCINIVYSVFGQQEDYIYRGRTKFEGIHRQVPSESNYHTKINGHHAKNDFKDFYPEYYLILVYNFKDVIKNPLDEWIYYLKHTEVKDNFTANGLKEVKDKLSVMRLTDEERKKYENYLNLIGNDPLEVLQMKLKTESLLKEKERNTKVEIAKALKSQYVPADIISNSTGLSILEIQSL